MKIIVGSKNLVKINAVKEVWQEYNLGTAEFNGITSASEVPAQPLTLT